MRITISIDDELLRQLRAYANNREVSFDRAVSEPIRRGLATPLRTREVNGFQVVDLPAGSPLITQHHIRELESS